MVIAISSFVPLMLTYLCVAGTVNNTWWTGYHIFFTILHKMPITFSKLCLPSVANICSIQSSRCFLFCICHCVFWCTDHSCDGDAKHSAGPVHYKYSCIEKIITKCRCFNWKLTMLPLMMAILVKMVFKLNILHSYYFRIAGDFQELSFQREMKLIQSESP